MKLTRKMGVFFDGALNTMTFVSGILLIAVMILVTVSVIMRYFFHRPLGWAVEVAQYMVVYITYLVTAWTLRRDGHVKMDIILMAFSRRTQGLINTVTFSVSTILCLMITFFGVRVTWELYQTDYFTPTVLMLPQCIFTGVIAFGFLMLSIQFMRRTHEYLKTWKSQNEA